MFTRTLALLLVGFSSATLMADAAIELSPSDLFAAESADA
jgi:hypothetical protein